MPDNARRRARACPHLRVPGPPRAGVRPPRRARPPRVAEPTRHGGESAGAARRGPLRTAAPRPPGGTAPAAAAATTPTGPARPAGTLFRA